MFDVISVLVIDDDASIRYSLHSYFEDLGCDTYAARSAEEAIRIMEYNKIDIAIVDIRLPGMNGDVFIKRACSRWTSTGFIIFTGSMGYTIPPEFKFYPQISQTIIQKPVDNMGVLAKEISILRLKIKLSTYKKKSIKGLRYE